MYEPGVSFCDRQTGQTDRGMSFNVPHFRERRGTIIKSYLTSHFYSKRQDLDNTRDDINNKSCQKTTTLAGRQPSLNRSHG